MLYNCGVLVRAKVAKDAGCVKHTPGLQDGQKRGCGCIRVSARACVDAAPNLKRLCRHPLVPDSVSPLPLHTPTHRLSLVEPFPAI